jgi:hypothetical protein
LGLPGSVSIRRPEAQVRGNSLHKSDISALPCRALSGLFFSPPPLKSFALTLVDLTRLLNAPKHLYSKTLSTVQKKTFKPRTQSARLPTETYLQERMLQKEILWLKGLVPFLADVPDG